MKDNLAHILFILFFLAFSLFASYVYWDEAEKIKISKNNTSGIDNYRSIFDMNATNVSPLDRINIVAEPYVYYKNTTTSRMPTLSTRQQKNELKKYNQYENKKAFEFRCQKTNITKIVHLSNDISDDFLSFANIQKIKGLFGNLKTNSALNKNTLCNKEINHTAKLFILDKHTKNITMQTLTSVIDDQYIIKQRVDFYYYLCYKNFNYACRYAIFVDFGNDFMMIFDKTIVYYSNEPIKKQEPNNIDNCETRLELIGANNINQVFKKNVFDDIKKYCKEKDIKFSYLNHIKTKITQLA